jgi:AsmA protein
VAFANAPGAREADMATLKQLVLRLQVLPLLALDVKVDSFVLVEPVIHLEVDKEGRPNWRFDGTPTAKAEAKADDARDTDGKGRAPGPAELSLGDVRLENGLVTYRDARSGQAMEVSAINMTVSLPDLASPFAADGSLVWNGEKVTLTAEGDNPRRLMAGEATPVALGVESNTIDLSFAGRVTLADTVALDGKAGLDVPSIRELVAWTGNPIEAAGTGLGPLKIAGQVKASGQRIAFAGAEIALDDMKATGDLTVDAARAKPYIKGRLDIDLLDLNPYLPPPAEGKASKKDQKAAPKTGGPGDWSDELIDLSGLKAVNADFDLSVGGIHVQDIHVQDVKVGRSTLAVSLKDGLMVTDLRELNLYDGKGSGKLTLDGRGEVPAVQQSFTIAGISARPLLTDAAKFDRLEGTGQLEISISTRGGSVRAMVEALSGAGAVKFVDGAIKGVNLADMVRNVKAAFAPGGAGDPRKTDFAELSGTFRINNGILTNKDLKLLNPLLRLSGAGTSDLPKRTVDYRVEPKVVGSLEGQGGAAETAGITVPVIIDGPWHDLKYRPDLAGLVGGVAKDPAKALEGAKETLKGLTKPPEEGGGMAVPDPGKALKKLFGN